MENGITPNGDLPCIINKAKAEAASAASTEDVTSNAFVFVDHIVDKGEIT